jgi:hypothetical protein
MRSKRLSHLGKDLGKGHPEQGTRSRQQGKWGSHVSECDVRNELD